MVIPHNNTCNQTNCLSEQKGPDMWHWSFNRINCQDALCIKLRGGIFQLVYPFLTHKHPTIHDFPTSVCLTRDHASTWLEKTKGSSIFGSTVPRTQWMTQQENEADSTKQHQHGFSSFAPHIHTNLWLLLPSVSSVYFYTCLRQYQRAEVLLWDIQLHLCLLYVFICGREENKQHTAMARLQSICLKKGLSKSNVPLDPF